MFADHAVPLDMDYPAARARFLEMAHGDWLDGVSQDAYADGMAGEVRVGPFGGVPGMSKQVRVSLLDPVPRDDMVLVPVRWEATGRLGRLFPVLDRAVLHRVAAATIKSLLRRIAVPLAGPAGQSAPGLRLAPPDALPESP